MLRVCLPDEPERGRSPEHPLSALLAVLAMLAAALVIAWARVELHGIGDIEAALSAAAGGSAPAQADHRYEEEREREAAVVSSRWATGLRE
jgi:hypothetical protein